MPDRSPPRLPATPSSRVPARPAFGDNAALLLSTGRGAMIIQSLLDTDLYKFSMMQVVLHQFPGAQF